MTTVLPSMTIPGNTAYMNPGIVTGSIMMPQLGAPALQYPPTYMAPTTAILEPAAAPLLGTTTMLPTTSSMVAYPSYGVGQGGPFTFYATAPESAPTTTTKPAASPAAKPAKAAEKPAAAGKKDAKAAKKKKKGKKCGCC